MCAYTINLGRAGSAANPFQANDPGIFAARADVVVSFCAERPLLWDIWVGEIAGEDEVISAIARLERGGGGQVRLADGPRPKGHEPKFRYVNYENIPMVNDALWRTTVNGQTGTTIDLDAPWWVFPFAPPIPLLHRAGDWDAVLKGLIVIAYRHRSKLRPEVYRHLLHVVLNQSGGRPPNADYVLFLKEPRGPDRGEGLIPETENHILMIESSRYLTNQLLYLEAREQGTSTEAYDNEVLGLEHWLLGHLQTFLQHDFKEFNARPYQRYSMAALQNLYDFAWDERVKLAARAVLDYISAKTAVSSNGLRRAVPFRRLHDNVEKTALLAGPCDAQTSRMLMFSGLLDRLGEVAPPWHADDFNADQLLLAALGTYRVPEMVLDLLMDKRHVDYFQQFHHGDRDGIPGGIEIYASQAAALLSAGGVPLASGNPTVTINGIRLTADFMTSGRDVANAIPTTVMPTSHGTDRTQFISVGDGDESKRHNIGVLPGFVCGRDIRIPPELLVNVSLNGPEEPCVVTESSWTFINGSGACPHPQHGLGFYAAVYQTIDNYSDYGFIEVAAASQGSFTEFYASILRANRDRLFPAVGVSEYQASDGRTIQFLPNMDSSDPYRWNILALNGQQFDTNVHDWPLARGDIMNSDPRQISAPPGPRTLAVGGPVADGHAGVVSVDNPYYQQRLVLDMRDPEVPRRYQFRTNGPLNSAAGLTSRDVFRLDACWVAPDGTVYTIAWDAYINGGQWGYGFPLTRRANARRLSLFASTTPVVTVARHAEHVDVFWCQADALITAEWDANHNSAAWRHPTTIAHSPGPAPSSHAGLSAVARTPDQVDVFWIGKDGSVWNQWSNTAPGGGWTEHPAVRVSDPGTASLNSQLSAIARSAGHLDVFWVDESGIVRNGFWDQNDRGGWKTTPVSSAGAAPPDSPISANSRHPNHLDVFWIDVVGRVCNVWWSRDTGKWHPSYPFTPAAAAASTSGLASNSRVANKVDVFWVAPDGALASCFWDDQSPGWVGPFAVTSKRAAALDSAVNVAARTPDHVDLTFVSPGGELLTQYYDGLDIVRGDWLKHSPITLAVAGSVLTRSDAVKPVL